MGASFVGVWDLSSTIAVETIKRDAIMIIIVSVVFGPTYKQKFHKKIKSWQTAKRCKINS